jgi:hypothetical protein
MYGRLSQEAIIVCTELLDFDFSKFSLASWKSNDSLAKDGYLPRFRQLGNPFIVVPKTVPKQEASQSLAPKKKKHAVRGFSWRPSDCEKDTRLTNLGFPEHVLR